MPQHYSENHAVSLFLPAVIIAQNNKD